MTVREAWLVFKTSRKRDLNNTERRFKNRGDELARSFTHHIDPHIGGTKVSAVDVAGRLVKKRTAAGTAAVRTDVYSYDSLGRLLSVDNDTERPIACSSAPAGTPIQDEEYKYDTCAAPDMPSGFSCNCPRIDG